MSVTATGRTIWYPSDAGEHDRELNVILGDEFGPEGALVMRVMKDFAAQQSLRTGGHVRTGFTVLAKKCFTTRDKARAIVQRAGEIGALDDLQIDADGLRFRCRVSGWDADYTRGNEALKKALQRERKRLGLTDDTSPPDGDVSPPSGDTSPSCPPTEHPSGEEEERAGASTPAPMAVHPQLTDVLGRLAQVQGLAIDELPVNSALQRAARAEVDVLDLADATVSLAAEYAAAGRLRANGAASLMHSVLDRKDTGTSAQLAEASAAARAAAAERGRSGGPSKYDHLERTSA